MVICSICHIPTLAYVLALSHQLLAVNHKGVCVSAYVCVWSGELETRHCCSCRVFDSYTTEYKRLKGLRTLEWKSYLGRVELDVEVGDRTLSLSVTPSRAVIVYLFQEKGEGCAQGKQDAQTTRHAHILYTDIHTEHTECKHNKYAHHTGHMCRHAYTHTVMHARVHTTTTICESYIIPFLV